MNNDNIYNILKNFNKVAVEETAKPVEAKPKTQLAENMEQVLGKKLIAEKAANKYAVGMSQAMKSTGDKPPLKKSTIVKAHEIAKKVKEDRYKTIDDYLDAKRAREQEHGGEEEKKSNKRTVVGHYGKHYDPTDDDEDVVQKAKDTSGEKRGRGRPKGSVKAQTKADTADIKADKKKQVKGNVTKVKSGKKVKEGQYKTIEAMIKEAFGDDYDEQGQLSYEQDQLRQAIGDEAFTQVQEFVNQGADPMALPDELYNVLYDHYQDEMPYGTQKARDGDPFEWISEKLMSVFGDETLPFEPDETSNFKKPSDADKGVERSQALRNRGMDSVKDMTEVTGDKPFDKMMGNIVKGAGALKKKSSNDKFEQVYDRVEVILMQGGVHSYLGDDIEDALAKLKIKPTDELIAKLETAFTDRSSGVLDFYNEDDMDEGILGTLGGGAIGTLAGGPIGGIIGAGVGQAATDGGSSLIEKDEEQKLNEIAPLLAAGARLFMAAAPKIAQVAGKVGQAGARGVGQAAKAGAGIAAKNAGQIGVGAGAYEIGSSVADIVKEITAAVGEAVDENTIFDLATLAFKYAIPAGIVLAILYGGKKAIDSLFADPKTQQGVAEGLGYSRDPAQAKWYHEGRKAFKGGTTGNLIQDIAKKHGVPSEWIDAFRAGYQDQEGFSKDGVAEGKMADKDYDKDGKIETGSKEHAGAVDKAIKDKAVKDKEKEDDELAEMMRLSGVNVDEDKLAKKDYDKDGEIETGSEEHAGAVDKAIKKNQDTDDEKVDECMGSGMMSPVPGQAMRQAMEQEGKMNINTNMSSDGTKSVSISADGEAAVQLMQMLKLAGMGGQGPATPQAEPEVAVVSTEPEAEVDEEKDPRYQANTSPEEHVMPVQALTKGGDGDVAGKEKAMTPNGYQFGDNPRAMREAIQGLDNFGHAMMKEYESIKIKK